MLDRRFKSRHLLTQRRACCSGLPRGPEQAPAPWSPPSAACAPRIIEFSGGCQKIEKIDLPPTMLVRRFKSRHLLTQRRACCPGLPRGPEQAPAPWSPPSAACAPRNIEFSGGVANSRKSTSPRRCWTGASRAGICLPRGAHAAPGCPEAPSRRLHPGVLPPLPAHLGSSSSPGVVKKSRKSTSPRRCWTGASRAGICLPRGAHAAPGCPEAPSRRLHPGVLPPLPAHLGSSSSPGGVGNSRKSTSPRRCWTGASRAGICLPRGAHAAPGCPEAPSRRLHPGVLPPLPAHLGSSSSPGGVANSRKSTSPRRCWTGASRAGICLPRGAHAAPGCPEAPSRRLHPGVLPPLPAHLGSSSSPGGVGNSRKSTSPRRCWTGASRAGICLPRGAHAAPGCPEAPSRRLHPGVLAPLPAHLGSSSSPGGVENSRKSTSPRRCWTGASRAGICLPRGAHAAPGCPEAPSRRLHPGVLPPLPAHLGSSSSPGGVGNSRKSTSPRRCWTGASRAGICLPRGAHAAPGCPEAPSRRLHPGVLPPLPAHLGSSSSPGGVGNSRKSTSPRRCWTGASRAGICLPRGAHAAPGCPEAPSRRLHPGVLAPLPAHLGSSSSPGGVGNSRKSTSPRRCWTGASRAGICLPRGAHAAPGCPEAPSRRLHPGVLPPLPAHLGSSSSPGGVGNSRKSTSPRRCWTGASRAGICLPRDAHAAPGCPEAPSRRLHPGVLPPLPAHLGSSSSPGGVGNSRKSTSPRRCWTGASRAGICLPRGAHAAPGCPEAPSRRLHPGVLPPLPAHLGSSSSPGGVGNSRKSTSPRRCWTGASRAGICLPRGAHAAPGCPEAPSRRLHPGVLPPMPAHLGSSSSPGGGVGNSRKSTSPRRCWTGASRAGICLPRGAHAAPGCPEAPSRRLHPGVLAPMPAHLGSSSSPGGVGNSRKSTSPRRCWTGASRAGICLPRDAHAAPGCPEAPSRRLHPGVLPPLPAHLG
jgi:hypothetical protein